MKSSESITEYDAIAEIYDHLMGHVEYDTWADYIMHLLDIYHPEGESLTDAGCGTGSMMLHLKNHGFQVSGFDKSIEMVNLAKEKTELPVWQADLVNFVLKEKQDVIVCLYDTMQYLKKDEILCCFKAMSESIKTDGVIIFDAVTEAHVLRYWADVTEKDGGEGWEMVRRSWYDRPNCCQHSEIDILFQQRGKRYHEHHRQWMYSLETWKQLCLDSGFEILAMLEDFSLESGTEESDRIHFVIKRGSCDSCK